MITEELKKIIERYKASKVFKPSFAYDVFSLFTSKGNKENFHSDIIANLLNPNSHFNKSNSTNPDKSKYLKLFVKFVNEDFNLAINFDEHYAETKVKEEFTINLGDGTKGRIDILIEGEKHCIIIENKMNDAPDTIRQLPKYYETMKMDYIVDAIIYLPKDEKKKPNKADWKPEENDAIKKILNILPAYKKGDGKNLVDGWLKPCIEATKDEDCKRILQQYSEHIIKLYEESVDESSIWDLYNYVVKNGGLELNDANKEIYEEMKHKIPEVLTKWLYYDFRDKVDDVWVDNSKKYHLCHLRMLGNEDCRIDIYSSLEIFDVYVFYLMDKSRDIPCASLHSLLVEKHPKYGYHKTFDFKDYSGLVKWVENLVKEMKTIYASASSDN